MSFEPSTDFRPGPGGRRRRRVVIAAALAAFALLATGAVALWSGDSWRDEAMSAGVFPDVPGSDFAETPSEDGWGTSDDTADAPGTSSTAATPGTSSTQAHATAVVQPASDATSTVPTTRAPAPDPTSTSTVAPPPAPAPTSPAPSSSTAAPSPSPTKGGPKPKPSSPKPTPTSSPTPSDGGCFLLIIC
ncbi:hypothetical protein UB45_11045 [Terrabacter sp. 28]|nr:hypothetical protein UB45_11045 [Terrabacter sp. 28]